MTITTLAEYEVELEEGGADIEWLRSNATFEHKEACEFIVHIGDKNESYGADKLKDMRDFGCSLALTNAYESAKRNGCFRVLFYC